MVTPNTTGSWTGKSWLADDIESWVELELHQNVSSLEVVQPDHVVEGEEVSVSCTAKGGTPTPELRQSLIKIN